MFEGKYHIPVMSREVLDYLNLAPAKTIVDATVGLGGHSSLILEHITPGGRLVGIDRDQESLKIARERLAGFHDACTFLQGNFSDLDKLLGGLNISEIDGILFDLGVSSFQLKDPSRGFSFQQEGPLDMRMDKNGYICAYDLLNNLNEKEISDLLWVFGQERWHNRIARLLVQERQREPIATTSQLVNIVIKATPARYRHRFQRIHPATRTFQAVRIAVNRELEALEAVINKAICFLKSGSRICVISFHSLEDRIVKHSFRRAASEGLIKILTPKPLVAKDDEVKYNPLSRSSKLRVAQKL
jgi:16S rRNA (cytosine1402-N4)-methyltransferase